MSYISPVQSGLYPVGVTTVYSGPVDTRDNYVEGGSGSDSLAGGSGGDGLSGGSSRSGAGGALGLCRAMTTG